MYLKPQPIITSRGLCFAFNARQMNEVFENSQYMDDFKEVFQDGKGKKLLDGQQKVTFDIDTQLSYLTDRKATNGRFW